MSSVGYSVFTSSNVTLSAATARTCLMVITPAQFGCSLTAFGIGALGTTPSATPLLWQIVRSTNASNSTPGTNNTNENTTIAQTRGQSITTGFTAFSASTSEPTVLTVIAQNTLTPAGGLIELQNVEGRGFECGVSAGLGIRLTAPAGVDVRCELHFERI
jgi:hypothetical protein